MIKTTDTKAAEPTGKELSAAVRAGMAAVERGDYKSAYAVLHAAYGTGAAGVPTDGLSHYGLCVAAVEKQTRKGVELCRTAIAEHFYDPIHYVNLIRLYLLRENRKNAVEVLEQALSRLPDDKKLNALKREIGLRKKPIIPFLGRGNPLNKALGAARHSASRKSTTKKT